MKILCGTDFSSEARRAVAASAHLARMLGSNVRLVHVLDIPGAEEVLAAQAVARVTDFFEAEKARLEALLRQEVQRVETIGVAGGGATFECEVLAGRPDEAVIARAVATRADLIVVSALGRRGPRLWALGSTADRIAQRAPCPVLVVRDEEPFRAWAASERPLRVLLGLDLTPTSDAALRWLLGLRARGPIAFTAAHVYWPPDLRAKISSHGLPIGKDRPEAERALERTLRERVAQIAPALSYSLHMIGGMGRSADHLAQLCAAEAIDLLAVGTHQRKGVERVWHGSVSRDAIVGAETNVACVPVV
jgi:nucleotide-binding universal stress UspA family protein